MTAIEEFLTAYDAQKPDAPAEYVTDTGLQHAAAMFARMQAPTQVVLERAHANDQLVGEVWGALRDIGVDGFLAGVAWEQDRQMRQLVGP